MTENELAKVVVDAAYHVHTRLGPGLLESVYETVLVYELKKRSLAVVRQAPIPIVYDELTFDEGFRADLIGDLLQVTRVEGDPAAGQLPDARVILAGTGSRNFPLFP